MGFGRKRWRQEFRATQVSPLQSDLYPASAWICGGPRYAGVSFPAIALGGISILQAEHRA